MRMRVALVEAENHRLKGVIANQLEAFADERRKWNAEWIALRAERDQLEAVLNPLRGMTILGPIERRKALQAMNYADSSCTSANTVPVHDAQYALAY